MLRKEGEFDTMRYRSTLAATAPQLMVVAIAEEAARQQGLTVAPKANPTPVPGHFPRVVCFGEWREQLAPQLAHPERLRPDHRLRCDVLLAPGNEPRPGYQPVDAAIAQKLGLPPSPAHFTLKVSEDPTRTIPVPRRTLIPERYRRPWEFQVSRENAVSQMAKDEQPGWRERLARFLERRAAERSTDRWRGQLEGKPVLEQLWGVRPPHCAFRQAQVRLWVQSSFASAGWDPERATREWEIFWRRKGV
jgi:hypothetical protein